MATKAHKSPDSQNARLSVRLGADHKDLIEYAAGIRGESVSSFAVSTLVKEAEQVVERARIIKLSRRDCEVFLKTLDNPPEPGERLRRAFARRREQVKRVGE